MDQATIDFIEAGDLCECCSVFLPEDQVNETGHGLGSPAKCQRCTDEDLMPIGRTLDLI